MFILQYLSRLLDIAWEYWHRDEMTLTQKRRLINGITNRGTVRAEEARKN